jgi:myo-inositol-1(or 4)-monophosphatase
MDLDLERVKRVGTGAAYKSAEVLRGYLGNLSNIRKKGAIDLLTEADTASEKQILETIRAAFPDHAILAEESGLSAGNADCQWIIDPLDGTTNFAHQLGLFAVSIAFAYQGEVKVGIVLNPVSGELFTAVQGQGAMMNGHTIKVSNVAAVSESFLVTGFPYDFKEIIKPLMTRFEKGVTASQGVRRLGSAALDLCFVACGRFDGYWEQNLKAWDTAAGMLVAREAGAVVTDFSNHHFTVDKKEILATNGRIHEAMLLLLELK